MTGGYIKEVYNFINTLGYSHQREAVSVTKDNYIKFNLRWDDSYPSKSVFVYVKNKIRKDIPFKTYEIVGEELITQRHKKKALWNKMKEEINFFSDFKPPFDCSIYSMNSLSSISTNKKRLSHVSNITDILGANILIPMVVYNTWNITKEDVSIEVTLNHVVFFYGEEKDVIIKFPLNTIRERPFILKENENYIKDEHFNELLIMMMEGAKELHDSLVFVKNTGFTFNLGKTNEFEINFPERYRKVIKDEYCFNIEELKQVFNNYPEDVAFYYEELPIPGIRNKSLYCSAIQFKRGNGAGEILGKAYK